MKDIFEKLAAQENLTEAEITAVAEKILKENCQKHK
ncbi:glycosyl transferase family, helical bundle domain protein [Streptococcus mutans]|nr:glycosyl transferase family, helical bundle domain protein [Streptococcus mutans]